MTSEMALQILSRCPKLRSCQLTINDNMTIDIPLLHPAVELESLGTLDLDFGTLVSHAWRLLDRLSLPELRSFTLQGHGEPQGGFSLAPFFAQWTRLETLNIGGNTFSKPILLDIMRSLPPTLRQLDIVDVTQGSASVDDDALTVLVSCCPRLKSLVIKYCTMISDEAILQFILAKMTEKSGRVLKRVEFLFNRQRELDILPSLAPFIETGLKVSLRYPRNDAYPTSFSPWQGLADAPGQPPYW
ncbi:hypothetical protein DFH06DRAFT_1337318 [Mycena polygramma]|nr:hypothetical protein DFH06DRAFT_1337318 [Mycena polygramma]